MKRDALWVTSRMIVASVPVCMACGWLDYRISFSRATRVAELLALLLGLVWTLRRWLVPIVRQRRDHYTAALQVEAVEPRFGGRLVSRVQFGEQDKHEHTRGIASPELIAASCERVDAQAADVSFSQVVDLKPLRKLLAAAFALLLVATTLTLAKPALVRIWLTRTVWPLGSAQWPRRTTIATVRTEYWIRRGDFAVITGTVAGEIPREGDLEWQTRPEPSTAPTGAAKRGPTSVAGAVTFDIASDGRFSAKLGPLLESVVLSIEVGDARMDGVRVHVVAPPELASVHTVYRYPEFTGRPPDQLESGDVRALVGTQVDVAFVADRPIQRAEISFEWEDAAASKPAGSPATQSSRPTTQTVELTSPLAGRTSFAVHHRGRYQIRLFDSFGFTSDHPASFVIDPVDNELPVVTIRRPDSEHTVTPATRLVLSFDASDDYGVTAARVCWRKRTKPASPNPPPSQGGAGGGASYPPPWQGGVGGGSTSRASQPSPNPLPSGERGLATGSKAAAPATQPFDCQRIPVGRPLKTWSVRYTWDLASASLQAGDEIEYHVQAGDAGEHLTAEKVARSSVHVLKVVDPETLRQRLEASVKQLLGELDHLIQQQAAGRNAVLMTILSLPMNVSSDSPEVAKIQTELNRQAGLRRQVQQLSSRVASLADELDESFLADVARITDFRMLAKGLTDVAGQPMQTAMDELQQARSSMTEVGTTKPEGR